MTLFPNIFFYLFGISTFKRIQQRNEMKSSLSKNKKYTLEFPIKSSPLILFEFLSTPSGLTQWFADQVDVFHNDFTFFWDNNPSKAKMIEQHENERIRFHWHDSPSDEFFEFKIQTAEITGDTVLLVTDFANPKDLKDAQRLWDSQVHELKMRLGGL